MSNPIVINPAEVVAMGERLGRKLYECGICSAYHPQAWNGDCRDDANRINEVTDADEVISWEEQGERDLGREGNQARLNNGCVCQSGCEACAALAESWEVLVEAASGLLRRDDLVDEEPCEPGHNHSEREQLRAALALAAKVKA